MGRTKAVSLTVRSSPFLSFPVSWLRYQPELCSLPQLYGISRSLPANKLQHCAHRPHSIGLPAWKCQNLPWQDSPESWHFKTAQIFFCYSWTIRGPLLGPRNFPRLKSLANPKMAPLGKIYISLLLYPYLLPLPIPFPQAIPILPFSLLSNLPHWLPPPTPVHPSLSGHIVYFQYPVG